MWDLVIKTKIYRRKRYDFKTVEQSTCCNDGTRGTFMKFNGTSEGLVGILVYWL